VESQFYLLSDIGEGALCLPNEPAFYWVSTNNGDDNQLFQDVVEEMGGNFWHALEKVVHMAPLGAAYLHGYGAQTQVVNPQSVSNMVRNMIDDSFNQGN
jgi:predicted DNA-binding transcriptional regulator YafY